MAIFWFGKVTPNENYNDIRIAYNDTTLFIHIASIDRLLWYDATPSKKTLTEWDAVSLYLQPAQQNNGTNSAPYQFVGALAPKETFRSLYQVAYRWNGTEWNKQAIKFSTVTDWRGDALNNAEDDRGWNITFKVPASSLGLMQAPAGDTVWRLGIVAHDRDYLNGKIIPPQAFPAQFKESNPNQWSKLSFGLVPSKAFVGKDTITLIIQEGRNGVQVVDGSPGGQGICGENINVWKEWGDRIAKDPQNQTAIIQNQRDIADWSCFSKYYLAFPLSGLPPNAKILSASLTLHQFGNSGKWNDQIYQPYRSLIQVFTTYPAMSETPLSWNSAPLAIENVSQAWVDPLEKFPGWPGLPGIGILPMQSIKLMRLTKA